MYSNQAALFAFRRYSYHAELKFELSDNLPAVHLQVKTPCKGTAIVTNINTDSGGKAQLRLLTLRPTRAEKKREGGNHEAEKNRQITETRYIVFRTCGLSFHCLVSHPRDPAVFGD